MEQKGVKNWEPFRGKVENGISSDKILRICMSYDRKRENDIWWRGVDNNKVPNTVNLPTTFSRNDVVIKLRQLTK